MSSKTDLYLTPVHGGHLRDLYLHPSGPTYLAPKIFDRDTSESVETYETSLAIVAAFRSSAASTSVADSISRSVDVTISATDLSSAISEDARTRSDVTRSVINRLGSGDDTATDQLWLSRESGDGAGGTTWTTSRSVDTVRFGTEAAGADDFASIQIQLSRDVQHQADCTVEATRQVSDARLASNAFWLQDTLRHELSVQRASQAATALTERADRTLNLWRLSEDTNGISERASVAFMVARTVTDAISTLVETAQRQLDMARTGLEQTSQLEHAARRQDTTRRSDVLDRSLELARRRLDALRSSVDSVTGPTEEALRIAASRRSTAELVPTPAGSSSRWSSLTRAGVELTGAAGTASRTQSATRTALADLTTTATASYLRTIIRTSEDVLRAVDDSAHRLLSSRRTGTDTISASALASRLTDLTRSTTELTALLADAARRTAVSRAVDAAVELEFTALRSTLAVRAIAESALVGLATTTRRTELGRHAVDLVTDVLTDLARSTALNRQAEDSTTVLDTAIRRGPFLLRPVRLRLSSQRAASYLLRTVERLNG